MIQTPLLQRPVYALSAVFLESDSFCELMGAAGCTTKAVVLLKACL